jgi:hypothetical protein
MKTKKGFIFMPSEELKHKFIGSRSIFSGFLYVELFFEKFNKEMDQNEIGYT